MFQQKQSFKQDFPHVKEGALQQLSKSEIEAAVQSAQLFNQKTEKKLAEQNQKYIYKHLITQLEQFKFIDYDTVWKAQSKQDLQKISIIPLLRSLCLQFIQYFCQIQYEVDVFQKTLISFPNGTKVYSFVNDVLTKQWTSIQQLFDHLCKAQLSFNPFFPEVADKIFRKPFQFIWNLVTTKFGYYVDKSILKLAIWNNSIPKLLSQNGTLKKQQDQNIVIALKTFTTDQQSEMAQDLINSILPLIYNRKKIIPQENTFFSIVKGEDMVNYQQKILQAIDLQVLRVKQSLISKPISKEGDKQSEATVT